MARRDPTPRTAIICAYPPELPMLAALVERPRRRLINGLPFVAGRLAGQPVVLLLSGMSLVNAAMAPHPLGQVFGGPLRPRGAPRLRPGHPGRRDRPRQFRHDLSPRPAGARA